MGDSPFKSRRCTKTIRGNRKQTVKNEMKLPIKILLAFPVFAACCCAATLVAQNPLRLPANGTLQRGETTQHSMVQSQGGTAPPRQEMTDEIRAALYGNEGSSIKTAPQPTPQHQADLITQDSNVHPAANVEAEIPKNDLAPVVRMLDNFQPRNNEPERDLLSEGEFGQPLGIGQPMEESQESESVAKVPGPDGSKLQDVAEKVVYNTLIVLSIGIGFVFVAKLFLKQKGGVATKSNNHGFKVLSSMKLAPKSNLMLVEVGEDRLVIATDPGGIKSVVRLAESFASTLGDFEDAMPVTTQSRTAVEPDEPSATYSLSSIGKAIAKANSGQAAPEKRGDDEEAIRKKMELALAEHGLKELVLNTIQKSRN